MVIELIPPAMAVMMAAAMKMAERVIEW